MKLSLGAWYRWHWPSSPTQSLTLSMHGIQQGPLRYILLLIGAFWRFVGWVGVPDPFAKVIKVIVGLVVLIWLINVLLSLGGRHGF